MNACSSSRTPPKLSVIVACTGPVRDAEAVVSSLRAQPGAEHVEIIVADTADDCVVDSPKGGVQTMTRLQFPSGTTLPMLWGAGIARSRGEIVAIMDVNGIPDDQWISATLAAHAGNDLVVGGAVEPLPERSLVDWAAYFCEYSQFMRPLKGGVALELPGNNIAFKRAALAKGQEFVAPGFWKTYWCRMLQSQGVPLRAEPSMVIYDRKSYRLWPFLVRRYHHGRCFAGMRNRHLPPVTRALYALGTPLLPLLFLRRILRPIAEKRRYLFQFVSSLPVSILAVVTWSVGECCGYMAGPGRSCEFLQ